jgi:predicted 3-demethylubiquinone-9 3-methyltransferase (glyoxalase superfamily)
MASRQKIKTFLWFDKEAEEAARQLLQDPDPARSARVMRAMLQMRKMDVARLESARRGQ